MKKILLEAVNLYNKCKFKKSEEIFKDLSKLDILNEKYIIIIFRYLLKLGNRIYARCLLEKYVNIYKNNKYINDNLRQLNIYKEKYRIDNDGKSLYIFMTNKCDYKCIFCDRGKSEYLDNLKFSSTDINTIIDIIQNVDLTNIIHIDIGGNEPLANKDFLLGLELLSKLNIDITINTTLSRIDILKKILKNKNVIGFQVPIYGTNEKIHDVITGYEGSYNNLIEAIGLINEKGKKLRLHTLLIRNNYENIFEIINSNNVDVIFLEPIYYIDKLGDYKKYALKFSEIINFMSKAIKKNSDITRFIINFTGDRRFPICILKGKIPKLYNLILINDIKGINKGITKLYEYTKLEKCKDCKHYNNCIGYYKVHFDAFGEEEIYPIK